MIAPMNYMVRSYLKHWNKELEDIAHHCPAVQGKQLEEILTSKYVMALNRNVSPLSYSDFKKEYPISTYNDIKKKIIKLTHDPTINCKYFAQSSGTTSGEKKLIPTPEKYVKRNHLRGSWYILHTLYQHDATMSVFKSKNLLVGGSLYEHHKNHTVGDVSGIMINRIPKFFRPWYVPSIKTAVSPDWETKIRITAQEASKEKHISLLGGIPTWTLSVCRQVLELSGRERLTDLWPGIKAYIHGGVSFDPYKPQFDSLIDSESFRYIEVYNATEGFFAFQDRPHESGMLLMCASGVFFEFIVYTDFNDGKYDAIDISDVALEVEYVIIISGINGLLRYVQGDVVKFVTLAPYRIIITGRIGEYINAFGEDLMLYHAEEGLKQINNLFDVTVNNYTVAPYYVTIQHRGHHEWYIEFEKEPVDIVAYTLALDNCIKTLNPNYAQKRSGNLALNQLQIHQLPKGIIDTYFREYGTLGGQSKLQKLRNDRLIADRIEAILKKKS